MSKQRSGEPESIIYGVNPVLEALRARPDALDSLFVAEGQEPSKASAEILSKARELGLRVQKLPRDRLSTMAEGGVHQGVVAKLRDFSYAELEDLLEAAEASERPALIVVLDSIQDPQNFGAIVRSSYALGAHGVVIAKDRAAQVTGVVAKASAGAISHLPIARVTNISRSLEQLKEAGLWTVAADPEGKQLLPQAKLDGPLAVVVGSEGPGVRDGVLKHCDFKVRIPMVGEVASLNASVSAALLLYEIGRQRTGSRR
jgi:23S rRNA (guanosine2251-2'-O)-methyltransferase